MTVKLRLMRMGKKKQPTYRIVATDSRSPRDGRFIEIVGTYAPRSEPSVVQVDNAKALHWLDNGAQPTDTVRKLLAISGAWAEFESHKAPGKVKVAAGARASAPAPAAAAASAAPAAAAPVPAPAGEASVDSDAEAESHSDDGTGDGLADES